MTVYDLNPDFLGENQRMLTNPKGNDSTFNGFEVTVSKRMSDRWAALASYSCPVEVGSEAGWVLTRDSD